MTNQTTATVVTTQEGDDLTMELTSKMMKAYGCSDCQVLPPANTKLSPGRLYISNTDSEFVTSLAGRTFPFSVRVVTFKVAMEMVKIDEGFGAK